MLQKIPKDKEVLNYYVKLARDNSQSKNITDILVTLIKLAADKSLDTIQSELDVHTFSLENMRIRVLKSPRTSALRKLLGLLEINEKTLTMGVFLTRLNRYIVQNDFIDLNDLYIRISPLLSIVFHFPPGTRKVPYSFLLKELKNLFV